MRRPLTRDALEAAKARVGICEAARALGLGDLKPQGVQRSPLRQDRHPSFSVTQDRLWRDHATGEGGDVVSLIAAATGCEVGEACKRLLSLAGLDTGAPLPPQRLAPRPPAPPPPPKRDLLTGLDLRFPTVGELAQIQHVRRWPVFAGLEIAARRGLLRTADVHHRGEAHPAWILTDHSRKTGQARRLDGEQWLGPEGRTFKSLSLRSDDDAPPGLADVITESRPAVMLAEGEADALAVVTHAWLADLADKVGVVCLTGAARGLTGPVLEALRGRRVRIVRHADPAGHKAALCWLQSLTAAGIAADCVCLDGTTRPNGTPAKDAADLLDGADIESPEAEATAQNLFKNLL